jgi:hypothetical protein
MQMYHSRLDLGLSINKLGLGTVQGEVVLRKIACVARHPKVKSLLQLADELAAINPDQCQVDLKAWLVYYILFESVRFSLKLTGCDLIWDVIQAVDLNETL